MSPDHSNANWREASGADGAVQDENAKPAQDGAGEGTRELKAELAELRAEVADLKDRWQRALADYDNLRKRLAREVEQAVATEQSRMAAQWLPVVDNLELAVAHAKSDPATIVDGVATVLDQAIAILDRWGYTRTDKTGERFDPSRHEAISTAVDSQSPPGTVLKVVRPGYGEGDKQLRPASVVVSTRAG